MKRSSRWFKRSALLALFSLFMTSFAPFAAAADKVYFYHNDPLGTPMSVTDGNTGAVIWQADYKPFGEEQSAGDPNVNNRTFIGKEKDNESGLHYFGARYHSSEIGRFVSPDPVGAVDAFSSTTNTVLLGNPQRLNYYSYSLNNPYKYVDKDGEFAVLTAIAFGILYATFMSPGISNAPEHEDTQLYDSPSNTEFAMTTALATGGGLTAYKIVDNIIRTQKFDTKEEARQSLSGAQGRAAKKFFQGAKGNSKNFKVTDIGHGNKRLEFFDPARNKFYGKRYVKEIDAAGKTIRHYKDTTHLGRLIERKWITGGP